jgi:hypothetical protein
MCSGAIILTLITKHLTSSGGAAYGKNYRD